MPLDWDRERGRQIELFVRRFDARAEPQRQLWLIQGGPGAPGDAVAGLAWAFQDADPGLEVFVPDHRGTGRSSWLGCRDDPAVGARCQRRLLEEYGEDVRHFSATQAARDLGEVIGWLRRPRQEVLVWGVSYGTVLVNRYLHLYPDQPDAALFDSACPGAGCDFVAWDANFDRIGRFYLRGCAEDPECQAALGDDPVGRLRRLYPRLEQGHCAAAGVEGPWLKVVLAALLADATTRPAIPAALLRLDRCDAADVESMRWFVEVLEFAFEGGEDPAESRAVYWNIAISELWSRDAPTAAELEARDAELLFTSGGTAEILRFVESWRWPLYDVPPAWDRWAPVPQPLFLLNGTLDPQTPHFQLDDARQAFRGAGQWVVFLPGAPHGALAYVGPDGRPCGMEMTLSFSADPAAPLRDGCLGRVAPPAYTLEPDLAEGLFGSRTSLPRGLPGWTAGPEARRRAVARVRAALRTLPPPMRDRLRR